MAPRIPARVKPSTYEGQTFWIILVVILVVTVIGVGIVKIGDAASRDRRIQSDKDIQACLDRNGVVTIGHDNWFRECTVKAP